MIENSKQGKKVLNVDELEFNIIDFGLEYN